MGNTTSTFTKLDSDEQKRLLDKLAKLKALSECQTGNVNETATAAATMTRIMLEYQIEVADFEAGTNSEDSTVGEASLFDEDSFNGFPVWKKQLLQALAEVNHCLSFSSSRPDYSDIFVQRTRSRLMLVGATSDIDNTRRMFFFCADEIERLCHLWGSRQPVKRRNDFKRGAASGIADKVIKERDQVLREERARAQAESRSSNALDLFDRKADAVAEYAEDLGIVTVTRRRRGVQPDAYHAGYEAGASLDLARGARPGLPAARA